MWVADLSIKYRAMLALYPWRRREPVPRARLARPLAASRVALVTTAGLVVQGDQPFDLSRRGGDPTYRVIPHDTAQERLGVFHRSEAFDRSSLTRDLNVVFPRDPMAQAARDGRIGSVAPRHLSFMGSITAPGRLIREDAPQAGAALVADGVDVALLVPV